jgi:hypothetical protein
MIAWGIILVIAVLALAAGSVVAFVRHWLRPRRARLDPSATGLPVEAVTITSSSGARLAGWYLARRGGAPFSFSMAPSRTGSYRSAACDSCGTPAIRR